MSGRHRDRRTPFNFHARVELARTYLDDGALFTAAERLEQLAADIRARAEEIREAMEKEAKR